MCKIKYLTYVVLICLGLFLFTGCYATRQMQTPVAIQNQYLLPENMVIPNSVGIAINGEENSEITLRDFFGCRLYTHAWDQDKLLELGKNYFQTAVFAEKNTSKCDFYIQIDREVTLNNFSYVIKVVVNAALYDANGLRIKSFFVEDSTGKYTPSGELYVYAFLEGLSSFTLTPILLPLGNYSTAKSAEPCCSKALNSAYSRIFEEIYQFIKQSQSKDKHESIIESSGTGFAVSPEYILTANHVVNGMQKIEVRFDDGVWRHAELLANIASLDVAILKVEEKRSTWLPVSNTDDANVGEKIFTLGFPISSILGEEIKYSEGVLNSKSGLQGDKSLYQISIPIQPGNSGGPVITESGKLIGMVTSSAAIAYFYKQTKLLPQNVNWATKILNIRAFLGDEYIFPQRTLPKDRSELIKEVTKSTCKIRCEK